MPNPRCLAVSVPSPEVLHFSLLQVWITLMYSNTPRECAGGFGYCQIWHVCIGRADLLPSAAESTPWQGGKAAAESSTLMGSPSETMADLQSKGVFPSSRRQPRPCCSQLCQDDVLQPDSPSLTFPTLWFLPLACYAI